MSRDLGGEWFVRTRGKMLGPFSFRQLEILRNQGRLAKFDEISRGDRRSWVVASTIPELFATSVAAEPDPVDGDVNSSYKCEPQPRVEAPAWHYMSLLGSSAPIPMEELIGLANTGVVQPETLVWTATMTDWVPARTVPALGLSRPPLSSVIVGTGTPAPSGSPGGGTGFSIAGFILGLLGIFCGLLIYVIPTLAYSISRNSHLIGMIVVGIFVAWSVCSLFAITFGTIGMIKASRDEKRRGMGLGIAALVLGMLGLAGLAVLVFIIALGLIAIGS